MSHIELPSMSVDSEAIEPLIQHHNHDQGNRRDQLIDTIRPGKYVWLLTFTAAISGLLFGYDTGVMSATLVSIKSDLGHPLSVWDKSLITSITSLAALIAAPSSGVFADLYGRKSIIIVCDVLFILGALLQAIANSVSVMTIGRAIVGLAIGAASNIAPLYVAEMSPATWRGRLVIITVLFITGGQVVSYIIGWIFASQNGGWRWMVGIGALPAIIQLGALLYVPESPRWLIRANKENQAGQVLALIYQNNPEIVDITARNIAKEIQDERSGFDHNDTAIQKLGKTYNQLIYVRTNRKALIIACMLQVSQQLSGFNTLMFFSATIFSMVKFKNPTATSLLIACTNFIVTLIAFGVIDIIGRRKILLYTIPFMSLGLFMTALAFAHVDIASESVSEYFWPNILLISLMIFVAAYALGIGNVPWQQAELFPLSVRALGSALATTTNWTSNFLVGLTFLPMLEYFKPPLTMTLYAIICSLSWISVKNIYPETKGLSLEEVTRLLSQ